ncbi:MAG: Hsp20/alpha crystallin family protein [Bacteriovoracaceae bacterium]
MKLSLILMMIFGITAFAQSETSSEKEFRHFFDRFISQQEKEVENLKRWRDSFIKNAKNKSSDFRDDLEKMSQQLSSDFEKFSARARGDLISHSMPKIEIQDEKSGYEIKAEVPGMDKEDIKVSLDGNDLTIAGTREKEINEKGQGKTFSELQYGSFSRTVHLKDKVDPKSLKVDFNQGMINVHLNKKKG